MRMRFTTLWVNDEDKAIDFYGEKLGFKLLMDNPTEFGGRFLMFAPPGGGANLVVSKPVPGRPTTVGGFSSISWETDDVEAKYEELRAKGVKFTQPPTRRFWGGIEAIFEDQDGNSFLLQQGGM
jgi:lactoylglutathione lyase